MLDLFRDLNSLSSLLTRRDKWRFVILLGLMFLASFFEAAGLAMIPAFITLVIKPSALSENRWVGEWFVGLPDKSSVHLMLWASGAFLVFLVFKNLFLTFVFYVQTRIVMSQRVRLGDRMFKTYQSAPYEWHLQHSSSELMRSIQNDTAQVLNGVFMPFLDLIMSIIMTGIIIAVMVLSTPGVALLSFMVTGVGLFVVISVFKKQLQRTSLVIWDESMEMIKAIQQGFGALIDARIIGCENFLSKAYKSSLARMAKAQTRQNTIQKSTPYTMETFAILGLIIILLLLIQSKNSLDAVLPTITLLGVATIRLKQLASQIANCFNQMNASRASIPGIVTDLRELEAIDSKRRAKASSAQVIGNFNSLRLENVNYTYPNTEKLAVRNISLELKSGESIAFVGPTGCGKSTLVNLILGLLEPHSGHIKVNELDIYQNIEGWRAHLGYIPQSIYLIDDTVRLNVAFGMPQKRVNEEQLWTALRSARLDEFVMTLPKGLDTIVGERGVRLSGGQRQRLGIARALYPNPEVLVMDEATSALDNKTEEEVMEAIQALKHGRTLIIIAHRLTTVEDCDRLYFLRAGQIENVGTYDELKKVSAAFREMAVHDTM
jgi:ABC-type multidrug transport system fused ATPase/permease subunit